MRIRLVGADDYDVLGELIVAAYNSIPGCVPDPEYDDQLRRVAERAGQALVVVAVDDSDVVLGGLTYVSGPGPLAALAGDEASEVRMFAVRPDCQRQGVGRHLMEWCIGRAKDEQRRCLVLSTSPWMTTAQRLYASLGFKRTPERDRYVVSSGLRFDLHAYALDL
jgi:ribosomal protein S18 acetylase RimI-like enzyme